MKATQVLVTFFALFATSAVALPSTANTQATCDLLSWSPFSGAACAAHCIGLGHKGGWCDDHKVCNCRD
ncbi:hypothetical protein D9756_000148 [Leucocoprinus leucothites]|uniref:Invertebrate defensins family profile domain-containing protein n=1 Tax=Leucocoprinus leucothites TaxID=201217 RepID=A0A8H5GFP9_9AGAR|nr:hypothetical protein D9756_000148 [Leucoagaricus leucothites]